MTSASDIGQCFGSWLVLWTRLVLPMLTSIPMLATASDTGQCFEFRIPVKWANNQIIKWQNDRMAQNGQISRYQRLVNQQNCARVQTSKCITFGNLALTSGWQTTKGICRLEASILFKLSFQTLQNWELSNYTKLHSYFRDAQSAWTFT
jgi:hypothetical protein